jgi:hypothetical protein
MPESPMARIVISLLLFTVSIVGFGCEQSTASATGAKAGTYWDRVDTFDKPPINPSK